MANLISGEGRKKNIATFSFFGKISRELLFLPFQCTNSLHGVPFSERLPKKFFAIHSKIFYLLEVCVNIFLSFTTRFQYNS
jgi:hypothetical protein